MKKTIAIAIGKGIISYIPFSSKWVTRKKKKKSEHSSSNALFCFTLWFRILNYLKSNNLPIKFNIVAELGTAGSLGLAFCALLTGSKKYFALEIEDVFKNEKNAALFEEIVLLFKADRKVPDINSYGQINIKVQNYNSYSELIGAEEFEGNLTNHKIEQIRNSLKDQNDSCINIIYEWEKKSNSQKFDFIFSRAVMEHVNDPYSIYNSTFKILNTKGISLHDIEFHSHNLTKDWNGHLKINNFIWSIMKGNRKYFLNRCIFSDHLEFLKHNSFKIIDTLITYRQSRDKEASIYGAAILVQKRE